MSVTAIFISRSWSIWTTPDELKRAKAMSEKYGRAGACPAAAPARASMAIGMGKMRYLEEPSMATPLIAMRAIKQALDPQNIMNPGKIVRM